MPHSFHVSFPRSEKELIDWVNERLNNNEISLSSVFRDALKEKKKEWDMMHNENPMLLKKKIEDLKQTIAKQSEFISSKDSRQEQWFKFFEEYDKKQDVEVIKREEIYENEEKV